MNVATSMDIHSNQVHDCLKVSANEAYWVWVGGQSGGLGCRMCNYWRRGQGIYGPKGLLFFLVIIILFLYFSSVFTI